MPLSLCTSLLYYRFSKGIPDEQNCVSIIDFEKDIQRLLDLGYKSFSISQIISARKNKEKLPEKSFCIIFQGGYEDNYTIAFPVIKETNVHVDIFIEPDVVGLTSHRDDKDFIPRFTWGQANEMKKSGLVDIYAFWHPNEDDNIILFDEIIRRTKQIKNSIEISVPTTSFYINTTQHEKERIDALKQAGVESFIIPFWLMNSEKIELGAIPFTCVNQGVNILDIIEDFQQKCYDMIKQEEDTFKPIVDCSKWDNQRYRTIELPIEKKPLIKNFLRHAFPLSVISASRKDKAEMFILYEYIDVVFRPWYHWFDYDNALYDSWDIITCNKLSHDLIQTNNISILDCIVNGLYAEYYCDVWIDAYFVPGKSGYNETHFTHNLLVYGYDQNSDTFKTLTYTTNGQYEELEVKSEDLLKSCSTNYFITANFIKHNKESQILYSREELLKRLKHYLHSQYNYSLVSRYNKYDPNQNNNFSACISFPEYLVSTGINEHRIYMVALFSFLEHKRIMGWRLKYILEKEGIKDETIDIYEVTSKKFFELGMNLGLKYSISFDESILLELQEMLQNLNLQETLAIKRLFVLLKYDDIVST